MNHPILEFEATESALSLTYKISDLQLCIRVNRPQPTASVDHREAMMIEFIVHSEIEKLKAMEWYLLDIFNKVVHRAKYPGYSLKINIFIVSSPNPNQARVLKRGNTSSMEMEPEQKCRNPYISLESAAINGTWLALLRYGIAMNRSIGQVQNDQNKYIVDLSRRIVLGGEWHGLSNTIGEGDEELIIKFAEMFRGVALDIVRKALKIDH